MFDYYRLLNISESATVDEIKHAYRKAALKYHPDQNNDADSIIQFILIKNAYDILINKDFKISYDNFHKSHVNKYKSTKGTEVSTEIKVNNSGIIFENILNSIFWDIEDLIKETFKIRNRCYTNKELETDLLYLLFFIEKWILIPVGLKDYFMESRQSDELNLCSYIEKIINHTNSHFPYTSIENYFFNLRIRLNSFLRDYNKYDLFKKINNSEIRLIDSIINVQNYSMYIINEIKIEIKEDKIIKKNYVHPDKAYYA